MNKPYRVFTFRVHEQLTRAKKRIIYHTHTHDFATYLEALYFFQRMRRHHEKPRPELYRLNEGKAYQLKRQWVSLLVF